MNQMNQMNIINQMINYSSNSNTNFNNDYPMDDLRNLPNNINQINKGNTHLNFNSQKMNKSNNMNLQNQKPNYNNNLMYVNNLSNRNNINKKNMGNTNLYQGGNPGQTKMKYVKSDKNLISSGMDQEFKNGTNKNWRGVYHPHNNPSHLNNMVNPQNQSMNVSNAKSNSMNQNLTNNVNNLGYPNPNNINITNFNSHSSNRNSNNHNMIMNNIHNDNILNIGNNMINNMTNLRNNFNNNLNIGNQNMIIDEDPNFSEEKYFVNDELSQKGPNSNNSSADNLEMNANQQIQFKNQALNNDCSIKIVIKLNENRFEMIEIQKDDDIFSQTKEFCIKNNLNSELIKPIYNYVYQSITALGLIFEKKMDLDMLENLKTAKVKYEELKEVENNYHSDSEIYMSQFNHCEVSTLDSNTSY